jgi:MFS family permease
MMEPETTPPLNVALKGESEPAIALTEEPAPSRKLSKFQHFAISSFWFGNNLHWGALGLIIVPSQAARLAPIVGMTKGEITGWTIGMGALVGSLVPPLIGAWSDRCTSPLGRRRPFVIGGTLVNIIALFVFFLAFKAHSLPGYVLAWMLVGLGNNIAVGAFSGIIPDVVPEKERGLASSWMATQQQFGTIAGFAIGPLLFITGQEKDLAAVAVIATVLGVVALATAFGTPERRLLRAAAFRLSELKECFWIDPRKFPDFAWVWITRAAFTTGWWMIQPNLQYFMQDVCGEKDPAKAVGYLGGTVLLGAIPAGIFGGLYSDRIGRKPIIFAAAMVMSLACLLFASLSFLPEASRVAGVYAIAILWGLGYGAYLSVDWALGTDVLPNPEEAGKGMGVWHLSMVVPQALAAPAAGLLLKPFSKGLDDGYLVGGYLLIFAVACVNRIPRCLLRVLCASAVQLPSAS